MNRFVRHKGLKVFAFLTMLGMVMNGFASVPSGCCCKSEIKQSEIAQTKSSCCNASSSPKSDSPKSCCAKSSSSCCSATASETESSMCACGKTCDCGTSQLPEESNSVPQVPSSPAQDSVKDLTPPFRLAFDSCSCGNRSHSRSCLQAPPGTHCTALQACAILSRFTC